MPYVNWPEAYAYLLSCPPGKARDQLFKLAASKVKVKLVRPKVRLPRGAKRDSIPKLKKELDRVFSIFIRTRGALHNGMTFCVTCGRIAHWTELDAGHYVPRQDLATRWDEKNVWPQCKPCNGFRGGEPEKMAAHIDLKGGEGSSAYLRALGAFKFRPSRDWLEKKILYYKNTNGKNLIGEKG